MPDPLLPLFAGTSLAARIESAERQLIADGTEAAAKRSTEQVFSQSIGGGIAAWARAGSPLNKVAGIGFEGPLQPADLEAVEKAFAERETPVQVELSALADPTIAPLLSSRGYVLQGFENVLGRSLPIELGPLADGVEVTHALNDQNDAWIDTVVAGFAHPDTQGVPSGEEFPREALEQVFHDMASADASRNYLARRQGEIAGGGSMRICQGVATLCGAATLPKHRRRGVQSTLLDIRLDEAGKAGCDLVVVTTQPGSKSQENVQKKGFHLLYTRAILVREV